MTDGELTTQPAVSIGETFKSLRSQQNLTIEDVATRLHLDPRIIKALENDAFEDLPASIFVRGYIRSYAKLVGGDADELIRIYDNTGSQEEPEIIPEVRHSAQTSSSDKPVKAFTYLLTLVFVVLVVAWWQSNFLVESEPQEEPVVETEPDPEPSVEPAFDYEFEIVEHPDIPYYRNLPGQDEPWIPGTPLPPLTGGEEEPGETQADTEPETPAEGEEQGSSDTINAGTTGPDRLVMNLTGDSWVEVFDADGQELYVNLARAGDTVIVRGEAPFSVLLGFAQGVSIRFNGETFDPAPYSRSGVARFTLGE